MKDKLIALCGLGQRLILLHDARQIAEAVLDIAVRVLDLHDGVFLLVDEPRRELYTAAKRGLFQDVEDFRLPLDGGQGITVAAAMSRQPLHVPDVQQDPRHVHTDFPTASELAVPVQTEDRVLGVLNVESPQRDAFSLVDQELLSILASQAALALENARLYAEERRQVGEMAILNELARHISANLDLQATLEAIVASAAELIPCSLAEVSLWDEHAQLLTLQALRGDAQHAHPLGKRFPPGEGCTGWMVRTRQPLLVPDAEARHDIQPHLLPGELPFNAYAGVPLLHGDRLVGTLVLVAEATGAFDVDDMRLLQILAHHAVIAVHNAQLFEETERKARRLAALNAVAAAINQPLPLSDILDHTIAKVTEVTAVDMGVIRVLDGAKQALAIAAHKGLSAEYIRTENLVPVRAQDPAAWVVQSGEPVVVGDLAQDPRLDGARLAAREFQSFAIVPLIAKEEIVGTLGVATQLSREFNAEELDLLLAMGHQIGVAVENARLVANLAQRARELEAVHAVAAAVNRPGDLDQVLREGLRLALIVTEFDMGAIALKEPGGTHLALECQEGMSLDLVAWLRGHLSRKPVTSWPDGLSLDVEEVLTDDPAVPVPLREAGIRLMADVPLFAEGALVGVLTVGARSARLFSFEESSLLRAIGHQLGTAIANARLRHEAFQAERLAAVGRVATSVAHDLRSPLGGILRSAEFLARPELSPDTRQKLSQAVVSLARRLLNTTHEILDYVRGDELPLNRAPCSLGEFLDQVLAVLEVDFSDRGIEVLREFAYSGSVVMDADRMAQVVYNIATNARDVMSDGGTFTVSTRKGVNAVELRFTDTGPGVPLDMRDHIFEPFFTYGKREGAGLGLSIARRIVTEHGGELRLEGEQGQGATFVVALPL